MSCETGKCGGLSVCGMGMGFGLSWAIAMVILGILAWKFHYGVAMVDLLASVYWHYAASFVGILFGALWGFIDGFVGGVLVALIYNFSVKHCPCKCCAERRGECGK